MTPDAYIQIAVQLVSTLLFLAVAWGGMRASVKSLAAIVDKLDDKVTDGMNRLTAIETTSEDHAKAIDRLEAPLFQRRRPLRREDE